MKSETAEDFSHDSLDDDKIYDIQVKGQDSPGCYFP